MRRLFTVLWGCLLPLIAFSDAGAGVTLRLVEDSYRPGDVVELEAEMRRSEYAEFELHVPAHAQLHFVAHTREPVRYVEGEYVQRELFVLQPMSAGEFELNSITATVTQGEVTTEVPLPSVTLTVDSYATEDPSKAVAELGMVVSSSAQKSNLIRLVVVIFIISVLVVCYLMRDGKTQSPEVVVAEASLSELITVLESGASGSLMIEQLLARADLSLSSRLRAAMEASVYGNGADTKVLLGLLKEEVQS